MDQVFVEEGGKYVPRQRFDLDAAKASTAFGKTTKRSRRDFEVRRHPIVQSIGASQVESQQQSTTSTAETTETKIKPYELPFSFNGIVKVKSRRVDRPSAMRRPSVKIENVVLNSKLSCDYQQQRVCLNFELGLVQNGIRFGYEDVNLFFPISDFIKEGSRVENVGDVKRVYTPINAVLKGNYNAVSSTWKCGERPSTGFQEWLPISSFKMETHSGANGHLQVDIKGVVKYIIERTCSISTERANTTRPRPRPTGHAANKPVNSGTGVVDEEKKQAVGEVIGALVESKNLIPEYPIIPDESKLTQNTLLTCIDGSQRVIPDIELQPYNGLLFRYEDVIGGSGNNGGKLGFVHLGYKFKSTPGVKALPAEIDSVRLNLKTARGVVSIDGDVDPLTQKLNFNLKDEAVAVAFYNLISLIKANQCDVDIYFKYGGYYLDKGRTKLYRRIAHEGVKIQRLPERRRRLAIDVVEPVKQKELKARKRKLQTEPVHVKSTFIVKINKTLNYPMEQYPNLYMHYYEVIKGNPFKINDDFMEYEEVFCPSINRENVRVYKSLFSTNNFLLFPMRYYIARNAEQRCISSAFFLTEEGVSEEEQSISTIDFSFTIAPALSKFDLAKLKIALIENNLLDSAVSEEEAKKSPFDRIRFNFPNDIGAETSTSGDELLASSDITQDGKYFNIICVTEDLEEAGRFITAMNSGSERYFNIISTYKELSTSAVVELDMDKTIGDFLTLEVEDEKILAYNDSFSPCHISNIMLINNEGKPYYNRGYFKNLGELGRGECMDIRISDLTNNTDFQHPKDVYAEYESIEDIDEEFMQEIDQLTNYYRKVVLDLSNFDDDVYRVEMVVKHMSTGYPYQFAKEKDDFDQPIQLTLITNHKVEPVTKLEIRMKCLDQDGNTIGDKVLIWDYSESTWIDLSLSAQK